MKRLVCEAIWDSFLRNKLDDKNKITLNNMVNSAISIDVDK